MMPEIMVGETWQSQLATCSAKTNFHITDARILEKFRQVLDAGISTRQSATDNCVLRRFIPVVGDLPKIQIGIIADSKRADFGFEITEATFR